MWGPTAWYMPESSLANTRVGIPNVVVGGPSRFGSHNRIYPFAALGMDPQDITYRGEPTRLDVGDR